MAIIIGDSFQYLGAKPLDGRIKYDTLATMVAMSDDTLYDGIMAYCVATDKTYQWKSTNPVDPDTGRWREFSSGGGEGQTIQVAELPAASEDEEGKIYQYIGADTSTLTHGYYYECVSDGEDPATYSWEPKEVQDTPEAMSQNDIEEIINGLVIDPLDMPEPMTQSDVEEVKDAFSPTGYNPFTIGIGGGYAPIGTIIQYMGVTAPQDYLICDGTVYNIADYPQLAEFFTAQFGAANHFGGDGTTTFAVPDLRGEFLRGTGTNSHENQGSGAGVGVHQDGTRVPSTSFNRQTAVVNWQFRKSDTEQYEGIEYADKHVFDRTSVANIASDHVYHVEGTTCYSSVRPTNTSVLYCIKAIVAGEVYSTEERVVGTWIDEKKIYQKTIDFGALPNNTTKPVAHNITNLKEIVNIRAIYKTASGGYGILPMVSDTSLGEQSVLSLDSTNIYIRTVIDRSNLTAYITLQYTKTA